MTNKHIYIGLAILVLIALLLVFVVSRNNRPAPAPQETVVSNTPAPDAAKADEAAKKAAKLKKARSARAFADETPTKRGPEEGVDTKELDRAKDYMRGRIRHNAGRQSSEDYKPVVPIGQ